MMDYVSVLEVSSDVAAIINEVSSADLFDKEPTQPVTVKGSSRGYVQWGYDNNLPQQIRDKVYDSDVMSPNMLFNVLTCYGRGVNYTRKDGSPIEEEEITTFFKRNRLIPLMWEAITDIKFWNFAVLVLILDKEGNKVVQLVHKEAMYIRLETCNPATGRIEHVLYANWEDQESAEHPEVIELLDMHDPWGDMMMRLGRLPGADGRMLRTNVRKFAFLVRIPTPGNKYYPFAYWMSTLRSGWYDLSVMVPKVKKAHMKSGMKIRYQVEIDKEFWTYLFQSEQITDPEKQKERRNKEIQNIKEFLSGLESGDKVWFSGYYIDPNKVEHRLVRINIIDTKKEGGDWIEDAEEAANFLCYAQGVHPHLNGATPGKNKGSQSGSDKRELFTMKQAIEKPVRDLLLEPLVLVADVNGWDIQFDIPDIMLTTLDQGTDAKEISQNKKDKDDTAE